MHGFVRDSYVRCLLFLLFLLHLQLKKKEKRKHFWQVIILFLLYISGACACGQEAPFSHFAVDNKIHVLEKNEKHKKNLSCIPVRADSLQLVRGRRFFQMRHACPFLSPRGRPGAQLTEQTSNNNSQLAGRKYRSPHRPQITPLDFTARILLPYVRCTVGSAGVYCTVGVL